MMLWEVNLNIKLFYGEIKIICYTWLLVLLCQHMLLISIFSFSLEGLQCGELEAKLRQG